jgi:SAM-dependent methyltransferase
MHGVAIVIGVERDDILERMREDWNARAQEDAFYYVAFGRRQQDREGFLATAADAVRGLEYDLARLPSSVDPRDRRALEIGCGPGRLMGFMSRHFGEIHGVDVSDEMIRLAEAHLAGIPHAHVHRNSGTDLSLFASDWFDFVYSYAVFQHIPSREVVLAYLRESARVLKPGGVLCCQLRGAAPSPADLAKESATWLGCVFSRDDVFEFTMSCALHLQWIYGINTQYMWITARKPMLTAAPATLPLAVLKAATNAGDGSFTVPNKGQSAGIACWVEGLPEEIGLDDMRIYIQGREAMPCYIGPHLGRGGYQINALLPGNLDPGPSPVSASYREIPLSGAPLIDIIAAPKPQPKVLDVLDGTHLVSQRIVETGSLKVIMMGIENHDDIHFAIDDTVVTPVEIICYDHLLCLYHYSLNLPEHVAAGSHILRVGQEEIVIEVKTDKES